MQQATVVGLVTTVELDGRESSRQVSVKALLEAELADGRRVVLLNDRGWSSSGPADIWEWTTAKEIADTARTVVGPDEPPLHRTHEKEARLHWQAVANTLAAAGVGVTGDELRRLSHDVVLGPALRARIS